MGAALAMIKRTVEAPRARTMPMIDTMISSITATRPMKAPIGMVTKKNAQAASPPLSEPVLVP
jgi:hypothetical protein